MTFAADAFFDFDKAVLKPEGKAKLEDVWLLDDVSGAIFLPVGDSPTSVTDIISGPALPALFDELRKRFQFILIDTAPVMAVADTRVIASKADATIFLVQWSKTPRQAAQASLEMLLNAGASHIEGSALGSSGVL